ncbi:major facilitator superfamily domain-containing protein 9-like [Xenia sp. Carnegie-2017]|uniref:major facilitator superfamily domain-containing protein 9-like n=1 Tax=Xenia sp. Carnegie-2017 TaxID=2897299 RepID=UPI001F035DA5|nr:major facilitator superfamily domain-containing protein 9-like [Xenia sp. Carnegie-2017]
MLSRQKLIKCCYFVAFMDLFAVGMLLPLFNRRGRELGGSPSMIGLVGSIYGCLQFLSSPIMGKASDVWGRKSVLLLSFIGCFIGYLYMGLASTILMYALARLPTGLLKHSQSSAKAYLSDITLPEERSGVFGWFNAFGSFGFIISPIIGGTVAIHDNGYFKVSLLSCSVYLFAIIFVWFVFDENKIKLENSYMDKKVVEVLEGDEKVNMNLNRRKKFEMESDLVNDKQNDKEKSQNFIVYSNGKQPSCKHITKSNDICFASIFWHIQPQKYRSNFTAMLDYRYGVNAKTTGYIISYGSIAGAISGMSVGSIYSYIQSDVKMMSIGGILMMSSLFGIAMSPSIYTVLICMIPLALSSAIMRVNSYNLMLKRVKPKEKGAVMGIADSLTSIARMLSPAIAGFAEEVSAIGPCWIATLCVFIGVVIMLNLKQDEDKRENIE